MSDFYLDFDTMLYISAILMGIGESQISGILFPWFVNSLDKIENLQEKEEYVLKSNGQVQYSTNIIGIFTGFMNYARTLATQG